MACLDEGVPPQFQEWGGEDPYVFVKRVHEARRSWLSQEQKALVIGNLLEQSGVWQAEQQRIQGEANRKRAEAADKRRGEDGKLKSKPVVPQSVGTLVERKNKGPESKANLIGVNRGAIDRAEFIKKHDPNLAQQVAQGEVNATMAVKPVLPQSEVAPVEPKNKGPEAKAKLIGVDRAALGRFFILRI